MTPIISTFDDVLPEHMIEPMLAEAKFTSEFNTVDGVTYEGIATNITDDVRLEIEGILCWALGAEDYVINHMFLRLMTETTPRSKIHVDQSMGEFSFHIYLSRHHSPWGTRFWTHEEFGQSFPDVRGLDQTTFLEKLEEPTQWRPEFLAEARFNSGLLHDSRLWHSAYPAKGFGTSKEDGRIVLTTFFSRSKR